MARLSWLLLPLLCGSSLAKEGSVVPDFVHSSSSHSARFTSPTFVPGAPLNAHDASDTIPFVYPVPFPGDTVLAHAPHWPPSDRVEKREVDTVTSSSTTINPLLRGCRPRMSRFSSTWTTSTVSSDAQQTLSTDGVTETDLGTSTGISSTATQSTGGVTETDSATSTAISTTKTQSLSTVDQTTMQSSQASDTALNVSDTASTTQTSNQISLEFQTDSTTVSAASGSTSSTLSTEAVILLSVSTESSVDTTSSWTKTAQISTQISDDGVSTTLAPIAEESSTTLVDEIDTTTSSQSETFSTGSTTDQVSSVGTETSQTSSGSLFVSITGGSSTEHSSTESVSASETSSTESLATSSTESVSLETSLPSTSFSESATQESPTGTSATESASTTENGSMQSSVASSTESAALETSSQSEASSSTDLLSTTSTFPTCSGQTTSESVASTSTDSHLVLTVATDGSGDFTNINEAIKTAQASGYPTVTVLAGTYTENVVIAATPTVTIVGEVSNKRDYASNKVVIDNGGNTNPALSFSVANGAGITWKNIKFSNSLVGGSAGAVYLRGSKNAFYSCQFVAAGIAAITGSTSSGIVANSYIEAQDKVIYNTPSLYIYGSTITATKSNALLVYNKGGLVGSTMYNSTIVFDTTSVIQKSGTTNTKVYMAAANGDGSVVVYRDSSLAGFLNATGIYVDSKTLSTANKYVEFGTTGDGSYSNHITDRQKYVSWVTKVDELAPYDISVFFKNTNPTVAASTIDWIDSGVLSAIRASNAKDSPALPETTSSTSLEATSMTVELTTTTSNALTSAASSAEETSTSQATSSAAPTAASCALPSSMPSTAVVVGPEGNKCASYNSIASAVAALPNDATTQYIYILAGTYSEKVTIARTGATIVRGQSTNGSASKNNRVTVTAQNAVLSSAGGSSGTATFSANKYEAKLVSFYNINFENSFDAATNYVALAVYAKGTKVAFYGCNIASSQGTLYLDYGNFFFSHSRIEGTTDFIWGQGAGYIYNSVIVSKGTTTSQTIAAQKFQSSFGGSRLVFDLCAVVPFDSSVPEESTYLGRDYTTKANVAFVNSYLDNHIAPAGWKISSASTFGGSFVEGNNTGPGFDSSARASAVTIVDDTSSYKVASILGDDSWLDKDAIAPFTGWPKSVYGSDDEVSTTTSASAAASTTASASVAGNTLTVAPSPTGNEFATVASAAAAIPNDGEDYTIYVKAGSYNEQLTLTRTSGHITVRGETSFENDFTQNKVLIWFKLGYSTSASRNEETPVIFWKNTQSAGLSLYNLNFTNTYPQTSSTAALAGDFFGTNMAAYGCAFKGFQDTLLVNQGVQVFSNSYVEGSVDFIWGYSKAYFHQCYIASNTPNAYITAQNRKTSSWAGGFVFDTCLVTYTDSYGSSFGSTYLGRPWSQYALVVYKNSHLDKHIAAAGWSVWSSGTPQTSDVLFGEFNNTGPGNWTSSRASFAKELTEVEVAPYSLGSFIGSTSWLDMKAYNYAPSYTIGDSTSSSTTDPRETESSFPFHLTDGTTPPEGAVLVSVDGEKADSYSSLTDALASLPSDSTEQVIFIYPGTYTEQVPSINRPGAVTIIGYTDTEPGKTYSSNQVTITQAKGLSVSGTIPAGRSNADTATIATASTKIAFYNVKFINTDNLDGSTASYVALAASVYGDKIGFYGCSFIGWQDTLLTGATAGYQYYESCYIEGAIDFIWGYSKAYFKGCTLAAKRAKSAITAQSRKSASAVGGYIFDQCLFTEAASATVDLEGQVYLGRPYSAYALVVIKNSYLDSVIQPAGWKIWSTTDPRTDYITFAEYANEGPGSWEKNSAAREGFGYATLLTSDSYSIASVMDSTDWIDTTFWDSISTPQPATTVEPTPGNTEYSGTTPPAGAYIVSKEAIDGVTTYDTIQAAINALPTSSKVTPTVFIYPGTYKEQIILARSGTTIFIGYSESPDDYLQNQVTITYDKGIDNQADASNSDSATFYATGNYFQAVNINFKNTFGTTSNYASLGFGVKSSKYASLYGCQVYGNQDALLINGFFFAYNSYFEVNIDMIWGSGAGYFLKSTISPNRNNIALTAHKRTDTTTAAGFVFDQCTITPANGASYSTIYLGRPWNQYARVAYVESELGSCVPAVGWDDWTSSDPRTGNVIFGEYENTGAGSSTSKRASFARQLSGNDAAEFELGKFFAATTWINSTLVSATPFVASAVATGTSSYTTVYTTQTVTSSQTFYTTTTGTDKTVTSKSTSVLDVGTIVTPDPTTEITVVKTTTTQTSKVTGVDQVVTSKMTKIIDVGTTITPDSVTKTSTNVVGSTVTSWATTSSKDVTTTMTITGATSTPKSVTSEVTVLTTSYATKTTSPKAVTVTSTKTVTSGTDGVTTTSLKATTVYSTVLTTSTKVTTKKTTITCIPTQKKRGLDGPVAVATIKPRAAVAFGNPSMDLAAGLTHRDFIDLQVRAAGIVTVTSTVVTTYTTNVKTSTTTVPGTTTTTFSITTKTTGKTSTLKPVTIEQTTTSVSTKYTTTTIPGSISTATVVTTQTTGKTTTLKASTTTVVVDSTSVVTDKKTTTLPAKTVTAYKTVTTTLATGTVKFTTTSTAKKTSTTTLPAETITNWSTVKTTLKPSSTVTLRSTVFKTTTSTIKNTITKWITSTSKNAPVCTN
ncbi:hypothetical protein NM208_g6278 [Fusarium decemcellulare]|uniref:Uncharacterized protein n=1 Tax=Fusarium decemcellulare TaxID=57161 RepID=A0ACC1SDQ2_9HYPO|nr:hypothetical protein NM208_g6278 [Fusarium decemcellulare]